MPRFFYGRFVGSAPVLAASPDHVVIMAFISPIFDSMEHVLSRKVIHYSSLFITVAICLPRLLVVQHNGMLSRLLPFNIYEWIILACLSFLFCVIVFYRSRPYLDCYVKPWQNRRHGRLLALNIGLVLVFSVTGGILSRSFFGVSIFPANGYLLRFMLCALLIGIELKVMATLYQSQQKERENEQLRTANALMELELLKAQLNPHFFFNALSSLSAVVHENPVKAQQYIAHLSKIFRYSLQKTGRGLTTLKEELNVVRAYGELMNMRHETGFRLEIAVPDSMLVKQLPHMSLQPLLENALKHNIVSEDSPLVVTITAADNQVVVRNNLQPQSFPEPGTGIGLANLNDRFRILLHQEISISADRNFFMVKIPVQS